MIIFSCFVITISKEQLMSHKHLFHIHNKQHLLSSYVLLEIFMQFVAVKAKM